MKDIATIVIERLEKLEHIFLKMKLNVSSEVRNMTTWLVIMVVYLITATKMVQDMRLLLNSGSRKAQVDSQVWRSKIRN